MGMGATNTLDRLAASVGKLRAVEPVFTAVLDVPYGGVLLALPALLVMGLLRHAGKYFQLAKGYYGLESIFLLLAFMALGRVKSVEALRYQPPGEWGKLLGLDRVPEVRTLRAKIAALADSGQATPWSVELCQEWMQAQPEAAAVLYVDGHVRVYHGHQSALPRHYVARERLCLRATTDYWVNAMDGQPFFRLTQAVDPGMLAVLEEQIVPRLNENVPGQPTVEALEADPWLHRFTVVFDREGYSPGFLSRLKAQRIACVTYHKYPGPDWTEEEFSVCPVRLASGEVVEMALAERGVCLSNQLWVREIRKLAPSGHQTSVLATDYRSDLKAVAAAMFARWSQENFFRYMRQHYGLDRLVDYGTEPIPETTKVVNPEHRRLDSQVRSQVGKLNRKLAAFASLNLEGEIESKKVEVFERKKADLREESIAMQQQVDALKAQRKAVNRHITIGELPEAERFERLSTESKHLIDTVKMVAYRAETAMAQVLRERMARTDDARSLLVGLFETQADLLPDEKAGTLTVRLHHLANRSTDRSIAHLCEELNATRTIFPGTELTMIYEQVHALTDEDAGEPSSPQPPSSEHPRPN